MIKYKNGIICCPFTFTKPHIMNKPSMMPCGHSACHDCINSYISLNSEKNFKCPFCLFTCPISRVKETMCIKNSLIMDTIAISLPNLLFDLLDNIDDELEKIQGFSQKFFSSFFNIKQTFLLFFAQKKQSR